MAESSGWRKHFLNFDIDSYLNPLVPQPRFYLLPTVVSFWFGYRDPNSKPQPKVPNVGVWISAFLGSFIGIAIITQVFRHLPLLGGQQVPVAIASFGAAAILEYNVIESPLAQPRNLIVGHFLSAVVGVGITKAFENLPPQRFLELRWLAGSISVGLASVVMGVTETIHPPAGATALLASTNPEITALGWWTLPLILLAASLMCVSAQLINNLTRRWPLYWWTGADLSKRKPVVEIAEDVEKHIGSRSDSDFGGSSTQDGDCTHIEDTKAKPESDRFTETVHHATVVDATRLRQEHIIITADEIRLPDQWAADDQAIEALEILRAKLHEMRGE